MRFDILTLFPDMVRSVLGTSIIGRAVKNGIIEINITDIRDFTISKQGRVDDYTYGGGAGLLMQAQPVYDAWRSVVKDNKKPVRCVYPTPQGRLFNQKIAKEYSKGSEIILLCGHYEGVDERVLDEIVTDYVSMGDYVLTGGEIPAMAIVDSVSRMIPGVLHNEESAAGESLEGGLLEYPQYSRPFEWRGKKVPDILLTGDHEKIEKWRHEKSVIKTLKYRPELLSEADLTREDVKDILLKRKNGK